MNENDLREELTRIGDRLAVGDVPTARILADARTAGRGSHLIIGLACVVVAAAVTAGGFTAWRIATTGEQPPTAGAPSTAPGSVGPTSTGPTSASPPKDRRLVGVGRAQISVPVAWGTNELRCGVPHRDTVILDPPAIGWCATKRPDGVDSVELAEGKPRRGFTADDSISIGGQTAERQRTACTRRSPPHTTICVGAVYLPALNASFRAESSTSAEEVDRLLDRIEVSTDRVAVPGFRSTEAKPPNQDGDLYAARLTAAGLTPSIRTKKSPGLPAGHILTVQPAPGTMLAAGETVAITVAAPPEGPAEELRVGVGIRSGATYRFVSDRELRAGATVELKVGDEIWGFADGPRSDTLAGVLVGSDGSLTTRPDLPNYPNHWVAAASGQVTLRLTITANRKQVELGTVRVTTS